MKNFSRRNLLLGTATLGLGFLSANVTVNASALEHRVQRCKEALDYIVEVTQKSLAFVKKPVGGNYIVSKYFPGDLVWHKAKGDEVKIRKLVIAGIKNANAEIRERSYVGMSKTQYDTLSFLTHTENLFCRSCFWDSKLINALAVFTPNQIA